MSIINQIVFRTFRKRLGEINQFCKTPIEAQKKVFLDLITAGAETAYGQQYRFDSIFTIDQFKQQVPVVDYTDLLPYINRMLEGEAGVLWNTDVRWFAKSSGTTAAKSKFIPVSKACLNNCHYKGMKDVMALYLANYPASKLHTGKALTLGGSHEIAANGKGIRFGDLSAILIQNTPTYIEWLRVPSREVALMSNFAEKLEAITHQAVRKNVTSFSGVPSWNLVLMKHILDYTGKRNLLEVWPNLEVFFHGGVAFGPYRAQFEKLIPSEQMHYMETYNASEGFFAIQNDPQDDGMLLILDNSVFYEFVKLEDLGQRHPQTYTVEDVEMGINYAMVISTNAGLWRYMIGDTIRFTSLLPLKIKITGRTAHYINVFGEELIADNAETAIKKACAATGAVLNEYTVGPIFMTQQTKGAHQWVIEFETPPENIQQFTQLLDTSICELNSDYEAKRSNDATLVCLQINVVPMGTFYKWMQSKNKLGGQNKIPRLFNTREYIDQLLLMIDDG